MIRAFKTFDDLYSVTCSMDKEYLHDLDKRVIYDPPPPSPGGEKRGKHNNVLWMAMGCQGDRSG